MDILNIKIHNKNSRITTRNCSLIFLKLKKNYIYLFNKKKKSTLKNKLNKKQQKSLLIFTPLNLKSSK